MNNIKFYRTKACKTASEAAKAIGISRQIFCLYENENQHRALPAHLVKPLCDYLECNKVDLLEDELFKTPIETDEEAAALIKKLYAKIRDYSIKDQVKQYVEEN